MIDLSKITELLDKAELVLLIVIPAVIAIWIKIKNKITQKSKAIKNIETQKSQEKYDAWVHYESRIIILKIKELCNVYKDRSHADQVLYMQLENGTTATSKLYNMFVTCLAEDNRYGAIPKRLPELQHIPYAQTAEWIEEVGETPLIISNISLAKEACICPVTKEAASHISMAVHDENGYFIGVVVFNYKNIDFNGLDEADQINLIENFKTSIETVFIAYHVSQQNKMKELRIFHNKNENNKSYI